MKLLISILVGVSLVFSEPVQFTHPGKDVGYINGCGTLVTLTLENEAKVTGFNGDVNISIVGNNYPQTAEIYTNDATNEDEFCNATKNNDKNIIHLVGNTILYNFNDKISQISFNVEGGKVIKASDPKDTVLDGYISTLESEAKDNEDRQNESNLTVKEALHPIVKWLHIIAGVMWIGLLYFFNFINGHVAGTMDGDTKKKVVPELMPRTLYWFRWGAAWTWFTGIILMYLLFWGGIGDGMFKELGVDEKNHFKHLAYIVPFLMVFVYDGFYKTSIAKNVRVATIISFLGVCGVTYLLHCIIGMVDYRSWNIHMGAMFGSMMAFNVWFRIWPAQQKIITAIKNGEAPDGNLVALAGLRSKHNTYMSVPLIWTMINLHSIGFSDILWNGLGIFFIVVALGWHIVFQMYKKSGKVKGF